MLLRFVSQLESYINVNSHTCRSYIHLSMWLEILPKISLQPGVLTNRSWERRITRNKLGHYMAKSLLGRSTTNVPRITFHTTNEIVLKRKRKVWTQQVYDKDYTPWLFRPRERFDLIHSIRMGVHIPTQPCVIMNIKIFFVVCFRLGKVGDLSCGGGGHVMGTIFSAFCLLT